MKKLFIAIVFTLMSASSYGQGNILSIKLDTVALLRDGWKLPDERILDMSPYAKWTALDTVVGMVRYYAKGEQGIPEEYADICVAVFRNTPTSRKAEALYIFLNNGHLWRLDISKYYQFIPDNQFQKLP